MISFLFVLTAAVFLTGIINRTRALLSGRKGVRLFQHLYNVRLLLSKGAVYSPVTGALFRAVPAVCLAASVTAALLVPMGPYPALLHFEGDMVAFAYLLALSRAALILGALDTGSSFEGMGASREALYGALIEPGLFFFFGTLALMTGHTSFTSVFGALGAGTPEMVVVTVLLAYILVKVVLVEGGRIPVDDPRTHLELTMVHEVMELDYGGVDLGLLTVGSWIKTASLATVAAGTIASVFDQGGASALTVCALVAAVGVIVGTVESFRARNRLNRNATYIVTVSALALFAFLLVYVLSLNLNIE